MPANRLLQGEHAPKEHDKAQRIQRYTLEIWPAMPVSQPFDQSVDRQSRKEYGVGHFNKRSTCDDKDHQRHLDLGPELRRIYPQRQRYKDYGIAVRIDPECPHRERDKDLSHNGHGKGDAPSLTDIENGKGCQNNGDICEQRADHNRLSLIPEKPIDE